MTEVAAPPETLAALNASVKAAWEHFSTSPNDTVTINVPPGSFDWSGESPASPSGSIMLSGIAPGPQGRLIIQGQGEDQTTLIFSHAVNQFYGVNPNHITIQNLTLSVSTPTVSQGIVVDVGPGYVDLGIQDGFPSPLDIYTPGFVDTAGGVGRALRRYLNVSPGGPQLDMSPENVQLFWASTTLVPDTDGVWRISLTNTGLVAPYAAGDLIAIKSKGVAQSYVFNGGSDLIFQNVTWQRVARGEFRGGFDGVQVLDCAIQRNPPTQGQAPCLSTASGGPQFGIQGQAHQAKHVTVEGLLADATGDNSIGMFGVNYAQIRDCTFNDTFDPAVALFDCNPAMSGNTFIRTSKVEIASANAS